MKLMILILILSALLHGLISCTKEELPAVNCHQPQEADCENFNTSGCNFVGNKSNSAAHTHPVFNPNDPDEFIFYEHSGKTSLVKFNMRTNEKTVLLEDIKYSTGPVWGRSGWIAYSSRDWKIWRLREDGSEHKQITNNPRDIFPAFSPAGDRIIHSRTMEYSNAALDNNPELWQMYKSIVIDIKGNVLDSICKSYPHSNPPGCSPIDKLLWYNDFLIIARHGIFDGLAFFDFNAEVVDTLFLFTESQLRKKGVILEFSSNSFFNNFVLVTRFGLSTFNRDRGLKHMRTNCDSQKYSHSSLSSCGSKIISSRIDSKLISECTTESETYIVIMDADGCNERRVVITE